MPDTPRKRKPADSAHRRPARSRARPAASRPGARAGWDAVAAWYDGWMGKGGSEHHRKLALPAALQLLDLRKGDHVLDIGCGQGVLAPSVTQQGAAYTGVDLSPRLLDYARQHHGAHGRFLQADACKLAQAGTLCEGEFDAAVFLLSIQDINPLADALLSAAWALRAGGRLVIVMTHPCFRIPRQSGWGFDEGRKLNYRRVDRYLTPLNVPMKPYPGQSGVTISFHRPLQDYINGLALAGLLVDQMQELPTYKTGEGRIQDKALAAAEQEIPLFMAVRARKSTGG